MTEIIERSDALGIGTSSSILVTPEGVRLPHQPAKYLILSNWNIENDSAFTLKASGGALLEELGEEIYWGFGGVYAHQLFPASQTPLIPVNNLKQISLRCQPAITVHCWYSWIL